MTKMAGVTPAPPPFAKNTVFATPRDGKSEQHQIESMVCLSVDCIWRQRAKVTQDCPQLNLVGFEQLLLDDGFIVRDAEMTIKK